MGLREDGVGWRQRGLETDLGKHSGADKGLGEKRQGPGGAQKPSSAFSLGVWGGPCPALSERRVTGTGHKAATHKQHLPFLPPSMKGEPPHRNPTLAGVDFISVGAPLGWGLEGGLEAALCVSRSVVVGAAFGSPPGTSRLRPQFSSQPIGWMGTLSPSATVLT